MYHMAIAGAALGYYFWGVPAGVGGFFLGNFIGAWCHGFADGCDREMAKAWGEHRAEMDGIGKGVRD